MWVPGKSVARRQRRPPAFWPAEDAESRPGRLRIGACEGIKAVLREGTALSEDALPDFSRIYEAFHDRVVSYAASLIGRDEAEDVAQEVFVKIGRSLGTLADPAKLTSWIYAITINTVRDLARMRSSRAESAPGSPDPDGGARTPEEIAIRNEMVACYLDYVEKLPRDHYEVYVLSEFEHLSGLDIARRLSIPPGTVKMRLHRARTRLNDELRRNCRCYRNERGELMGEPK